MVYRVYKTQQAWISTVCRISRVMRRFGLPCIYNTTSMNFNSRIRRVMGRFGFPCIYNTTGMDFYSRISRVMGRFG